MVGIFFIIIFYFGLLTVRKQDSYFNSLYVIFFYIALFRLLESKQIVFNAKIKPCVSLSYDFSNYRAVNGRIAYVSNMSSSL